MPQTSGAGEQHIALGLAPIEEDNDRTGGAEGSFVKMDGDMSEVKGGGVGSDNDSDLEEEGDDEVALVDDGYSGADNSFQLYICEYEHPT